MKSTSTFFLLALALIATNLSGQGVARASAKFLHPLDPLTKVEIQVVADVLKKSGKVPVGSVYPGISLQEPPKAEVLKFKTGQPFRREAFVIVFDRDHSRTFETVVDLRKKSILSWKEIPGVQPPISVEELNLVPKIVKADAQWQEAMKKRGITDFEQVMFDPWAPGTLAAGESKSVRWIRCLSYFKGKANNGYARPIEGVIAVVNLNEKKVERLIDSGSHPMPPESADFDEKSRGTLRAGPKPLSITHPQGPSFVIKGNEVIWQKWHIRYGVHPREGLVIYTVGYEDQGKIRPILYRGSISEMVVPYGDSDANWSWRNAFDVGEYGIGKLVTEMERGTDAPENATLLDVVQADDFGKPVIYKKAVGIYERDGGLLWRHFDFYTNQTNSRRARELVITSIMTIGNYDYALDWIFKQDGSLELKALLTGIMLPKGVDVTRVGGHHAEKFWHLVAPNVGAPHHQHFFNFRLDLDVDGPDKNQVAEFNVVPLPRGPENPSDNALQMEDTILRTEMEARRDMRSDSSRKWIVLNPTVHNRLGHASAFALVPGENSIPYAHPQSSVRKRAGFVNHHFWATQYAPEELYAAGAYPNQSEGGDGLERWTADNSSLDGKDVVAWYTFGVTHIPRPEEWPVMSVATAGFKLLPVGFFSENPAMDVRKK